MAIIWGFNLSEMSWSAFAHRRMFDTRWHLRKQRFIVYQLAMLIGLAAECTATYALSKYESHQSHIEEATGHRAIVRNNDFIAAAVLSVVFCVLVATLFGADFFFLVFWPRRRYPRWYILVKEALAVGITLGMAAACIMSTIVIATHSETVSGINPAEKEEVLRTYFRPPLKYNKWAPNIVYLVLLWLGFVFTIASTILMFFAAAHDERYGTEPKGSGSGMVLLPGEMQQDKLIDTNEPQFTR